MTRRFARPYARALMEAAGTPQKANEIREELMRFENALRTSPELRDLYVSPAVDMEAKLTLTRDLAKRMKLSELATKMAEVLVRFHRMQDIGAILEAVRASVNAALGIAVAEVRSAKSLSSEEQQQLVAVLSQKTGKSVELDVRTDPRLLGGLVVKIGSQIFDASVVGKITKFRESLT